MAGESLQLEMLMQPSMVEAEPQAVDELTVMVDAVKEFAERFGTQGETAAEWRAIFDNPQPDYMPAGCLWMSRQEPGEMRDTVWGSK